MAFRPGLESSETNRSSTTGSPASLLRHQESDESGSSSDETPKIEDFEELDPADVFFKMDIFDSVIVAAFGGVQMNLDGFEELNVHPGILWIFCVPLVCAQFALTFSVGLNIDLETSIWDAESATLSEGMQITIKVLLIIVCQITFFDRMLGTLRLILFCLNPASWTDIKRIDADSRREAGSRLWCVHAAGFLAFFPISALVMKFILQYYVNVQSASIILASSDLNEAIFDSLAIAFIMELDATMWQFTKTILHLDDFDSFVFRLWPAPRRAQATRQSALRPLLLCRCLHRGSGARRLENFLAFMMMFVIYFRLLMNILYALKTNTVPAARDVCMQWRWLEGNPNKHPWIATLFRLGVTTILSPFDTWWTPAHEVARKARPICTESHKETSADHWVELALEYPGFALTVSAVLISLLIVPELFLEKGGLRDGLVACDRKPEEELQAIRRTHTSPTLDFMQASAKGNAKRIHRLRHELLRNEEAMAGLVEDNRKLHEQVQHLHGRLLRAGL